MWVGKNVFVFNTSLYAVNGEKYIHNMRTAFGGISRLKLPFPLCLFSLL